MKVEGLIEFSWRTAEFGRRIFNMDQNILYTPDLRPPWSEHLANDLYLVSAMAQFFQFSHWDYCDTIFCEINPKCIVLILQAADARLVTFSFQSGAVFLLRYQSD